MSVEVELPSLRGEAPVHFGPAPAHAHTIKARPQRRALHSTTRSRRTVRGADWRGTRRDDDEYAHEQQRHEHPGQGELCCSRPPARAHARGTLQSTPLVCSG